MISMANSEKSSAEFWPRMGAECRGSCLDPNLIDHWAKIVFMAERKKATQWMSGL